MKGFDFAGTLLLSSPLVLLLVLSGHSQSPRCVSRSVDAKVRCAHIGVEFGEITTSKLSGTVESPLKEPILIEVFRIPTNETKGASYNLDSYERLVVAFETDKKGKFCHPGLPDGNYLVRFGTIHGDWNCSYQKIRIRRGSSERKSKVTLEIGI